MATEENGRPGNLVLSRFVGESIQIGPDIKVTLYEIRSRHKARIAIEAPKTVKIYRTELVKRGAKVE